MTDFLTVCLTIAVVSCIWAVVKSARLKASRAGSLKGRLNPPPPAVRRVIEVDVPVLLEMLKRAESERDLLKANLKSFDPCPIHGTHENRFCTQ